MKDYIKKKGNTIPFGYELSEIKGYLKPIPKQQELLLKYITLVQEKKYSLREAAEQLSLEADRKISHVGLSKIIKKVTPAEPRSRFTVATQRKRALAKKEKAIQKEKAKLAILAKLELDSLLNKTNLVQLPCTSLIGKASSLSPSI